jgi:hypothetical protein
MWFIVLLPNDDFADFINPQYYSKNLYTGSTDICHRFTVFLKPRFLYRQEAKVHQERQVF